MKILVFGKNGQVATELGARAGTICLGRDQADLTVAGRAKAAILEHQPDAVINAAAYTAVDQAETDENAALKLNRHAPAEMAQTCAALEIPFVTISTDYVFEGGGTKPWAPQDTPAPLGAYGRTKLAGEQAVLSASGNAAVLRTSWVFSAHGNNFVKTMLRLGRDRDALTIVGDQIGGPTSAADIASVCLKMARKMVDRPDVSGVFHFCGTPDVSWADFATEIFKQANLTCDVTPIPSSDYPTPAVRPLNSRLDCASLGDVFEIDRPDWAQSLASVLKELEQDF